MTLRINVKRDVENTKKDLCFQIVHLETAAVEYLEELAALESVSSGPELVGITTLPIDGVTI